MGVAPNSSISIGFSMVFHYKPSRYWGTPIYGTPHSKLRNQSFAMIMISQKGNSQKTTPGPGMKMRSCHCRAFAVEGSSGAAQPITWWLRHICNHHTAACEERSGALELGLSLYCFKQKAAVASSCKIKATCCHYRASLSGSILLEASKVLLLKNVAIEWHEDHGLSHDSSAWKDDF